MTMTTLFWFLGASAALTLAPGPDNLFIIAQGLSRGRRAAVITAWGMCSGLTIHTGLAAAGVSAVLYASAAAFQILKTAGAAYLLFLAVQTARHSGPAAPGGSTAPVDQFACFRRGFFMNVLNPKVALFFLAFLPQFTSKEAGRIGLQMAGLGLIFMLQALILFTIIGFFSGMAGDFLLRNPRTAKRFSWLSAGILAVLSLRLALTQR